MQKNGTVVIKYKVNEKINHIDCGQYRLLETYKDDITSHSN